MVLGPQTTTGTADVSLGGWLYRQGSIGRSGVRRSIQQCTALGQARCIIGYSGVLRSDQLNPATVIVVEARPGIQLWVLELAGGRFFSSLF